MKLVLWLEEFSAQVLLENMIPNFFKEQVCHPDLVLEYHCFQGKNDLKKNIVNKLKQYRTDPKDSIAHLILFDKDLADCLQQKENLLLLFESENINCKFLIRIACCELETFYLADFLAVETSLQISLAKHKNKSKYRNPDLILKPSDELGKLTKGLYQKVSGSREIGKHLDISNTRSRSFKHLVLGIKNLLTSLGLNDHLG